jgi:hypothetical protein
MSNPRVRTSNQSPHLYGPRRYIPPMMCVYHQYHHNDTKIDPTGCAAHGSCRDCAVASHFCRWCVTGIDCYDNSHCQRTQPEPYHPRKNNHHNDNNTDDDLSTPTMGWLPMLIIGLVAGMAALCCITSCC